MPDEQGKKRGKRKRQYGTEESVDLRPRFDEAGPLRRAIARPCWIRSVQWVVPSNAVASTVLCFGIMAERAPSGARPDKGHHKGYPCGVLSAMNYILSHFAPSHPHRKSERQVSGAGCEPPLALRSSRAHVSIVPSPGAKAHTIAAGGTGLRRDNG